MTSRYFDHAASAPRRPEVLEAMTPFLTGVVANPSGSHRAARQVKRALEDAREEVATLLGVAPGGVIFTGGGTESCHLAIHGSAHRFRRERGETDVVVSAIEHHAILESADDLARDFPEVAVRTVGVGDDGVIDLVSLERSLGENTAIVSVMTANNETGVIQPIDAVVEVTRRTAPHAVVHTDAIAAAPWLDLAAVTEGVDLVSVCAHKIGGPVNAGALVLRTPVSLDAVIGGGGQERGRRGGTVDVAAAVGLATALRLTSEERDVAVSTTTRRRDALASLIGSLEGVRVTAAASPRLPGHVHLTVADLASDEILFLLDQEGVCASAASSCASGASAASHVLAAMGVAPERSRGAVRFTIGAETTDEDVAAVADAFARALATLRNVR